MSVIVLKQEKGNNKEKILFREYIDNGVFYRVRVNILDKLGKVIKSDVIPCFTYINALFTYEDCDITQ